MHALHIFDDGLEKLSPMTDLRASFDIRTGAWTTLERVRRWIEPAGLIVPERLAALTRERHADIELNDLDKLESESSVLLLNGSAPLAGRDVAGIQLGEGVIDPQSGRLVAACLPGADAFALVRRARAGEDCHGHVTNVYDKLVSKPGMTDGKGALRLRLLTRPWHVRTLRDACIVEDLRDMVRERLSRCDWPQLPAGTLRIGTTDLYVEPSATIFPGVILDSTSGNIYIDERAVIRPGVVITGPAYIGPDSHVLDRAIIKANTAIGPWCKVAGEIGGTIFQGFANKAHDGHLGDSWIGEWCNLGAGTTNSNLLNTYGEVISRGMDDSGEPGPQERTGEVFFGCVLGDHTRTAICTRIMTGAIVGTGTMWAATPPMSGTVARFTWATDGGGGVRPGGFRFEKFVEVMKAAMGRRKIEPSQAYIEAMKGLYP